MPSELHGIHQFLKAMEERQSWKNTYYTEKYAWTSCMLRTTLLFRDLRPPIDSDLVVPPTQ